MTRERRLGRALAIRVTAATALVLVAALAALVWSLVAHLRASADADLDAATALVNTADAEHPRTVDEARLSRLLPGRALIALADEDGTIIAMSATAVKVAALPLDHEPGTHFTFASGGHHFRGTIVERPNLVLTTADGSQVNPTTLLIAIDISADRTTVRAATGFALAIAIAALALVSITTGAVMRRSLRPLAAMSDTARRIAASGAPESMPATPWLETQSLAAAFEHALHRRLAAEQAVRDFVADASHELRTPIAKVQGWADLLAAGDLDPDQSLAAVDAISDATTELATMVTQLAWLAKLEAPISAPIEQVDIVALASDVADEAAQVSPEAAVTVAGSGIAITVSGRAQELRTALRNLVGNAVQHGGGSVTLHIADAGDVVDVTVSDHGPGIPEPLRERVLDRFFTTAPSGSQHSGLGLAIVAAVARGHGGSVVVTAAPGGGAAVIMRLPKVVSKP